MKKIMSRLKQINFSKEELKEKNSLIKISSLLKVQSLYEILKKNPYIVNTIDDKKETLLSYSIKNGNTEVSSLILASPIIDLDYQDKDGNSYLHLAVMNRQEDIIKLLIKKGIFINKQNKNGNSGLHLAYIKNDNSIIKILLESGIDKNIVNKENKLAKEMKIKSTKFNSNSSNKMRTTKLIYNNKFLYEIKKNKNNIDRNIFPKYNVVVNKEKKENNIIKNFDRNYKKSMRSCKSGKIKANNKQGKKKNRESYNYNSNYNFDTEKTFNDIINFEDDYKIKNNNYNYSNQKCSQFDKTIKIDWSMTNKYIINSKQKNEDIYLNGNNEEKKNSLGKDQDICNFEDNHSFYNQKFDVIPEKNSLISKVNNKTSNINYKVSPKIKNNKKNIINNKNRNYLRNSSGYNLFTNEEYTNNSEQTSSKNPSKNIFRNNLDITSNHYTEEINKGNESKMNTIYNNDNFMDFNDNSESLKLNNDNNDFFNQRDKINSLQPFSSNLNHNQNKIKGIKNANKKIINNIPKRKTVTSNTIKRHILSKKYNKTIKEEKNLNIKSLNLESSLVTQSRIKSSQKRNGPLIEFLSQINMIKYFNNLDSNGFDDINLLIDQAKNGNIVTDHELKEAGINIPGDRAKILIRIKEKANIFGFTIPKSVYYICQNLDKIENDQHIKILNQWLAELKIEQYLINFLNNGYHSIELLLMQMGTEYPLTTEILRDEIGIDKIGYRSRILNKLKEEATILNNKLKSSSLVVNNIENNKNCECYIF